MLAHMKYKASSELLGMQDTERKLARANEFKEAADVANRCSPSPSPSPSPSASTSPSTSRVQGGGPPRQPERRVEGGGGGSLALTRPRRPWL